MHYSYDLHGKPYSQHRRTDPRVAAQIYDALGPCGTLLNVGAGTGSYEPTDCIVVAVEPSSVMRAQRPASSVPAIRASAEALPFDDSSFDASMALLTVHHWPDVERGLTEMRRVTRGRIVIMTYDGDAMKDFWLFDYIPELIDVERRRFPAIATLNRILSPIVANHVLSVPSDCMDGFNEAYFNRPEAFLDLSVRQSQSAWSLLPSGVEQRFVQELDSDLASGAWDARYGNLRHQNEYRGAIRLIVSDTAL